jgi:hypothetical protein
MPLPYFRFRYPYAGLALAVSTGFDKGMEWVLLLFRLAAIVAFD